MTRMQGRAPLSINSEAAKKLLSIPKQSPSDLLKLRVRTSQEGRMIGFDLLFEPLKPNEKKYRSNKVEFALDMDAALQLLGSELLVSDEDFSLKHTEFLGHVPPLASEVIWN